MKCWVCNEELVWGGDHDIDEDVEIDNAQAIQRFRLNEDSLNKDKQQVEIPSVAGADVMGYSTFVASNQSISGNTSQVKQISSEQVIKIDQNDTTN